MGVKYTDPAADIRDMIISEEQAMLAARYRTSAGMAEPSAHTDVSPELLAKVRATVIGEPDVRLDRVDEARVRLSAGSLDCRDVACKMLSRIVSDSLR